MKKSRVLISAFAVLLFFNLSCTINSNPSNNENSENSTEESENSDKTEESENPDESENTEGSGTSGESGETENTDDSTDQTEDSPLSVENGFYVDGTKLFDANKNQFVIRGINHAHAWYKPYDDTALEAIAKTGANTVRLVCSDGTQFTGYEDDEDSLKTLIEKCKSLDMISILEVHDGTGSNETSKLEEICDFWEGMADVLEGTEAYVIVNIANEWGGHGKAKYGMKDILRSFRNFAKQELKMHSW